MDITKVKTGVFIEMREIRIASNIYQLLGNTVVGDVTPDEFDNDATQF